MEWSPQKYQPHLVQLADPLFSLKKLEYWAWRGGSVVKSTDCSSSGPEFNSQQPRGGLQDL